MRTLICIHQHADPSYHEDIVSAHIKKILFYKITWIIHPVQNLAF